MNIPKRYENAEWDQVPAVIQNAIEKMLKEGKGIYLHGGVGTGKTHICWAFKKKYFRPWDGATMGRDLTMWNVVDLMHEIKSDFDRGQFDKRRPEEGLTDMDDKRILILDDIGVEKATDFVAETLYRIINHRYINMLPTIFTSNLPIKDLADKIGERSASRIMEMCDIYELTGVDRRIN